MRRAQRDPEAFASFYEAYRQRVLVFFVRRLLDPEVAFDLMAESFAKALELRAQFRGETPEEEQGWLFAIARSELSHYWRDGAVEKAALRRLGIIERPLTPIEIERVEQLADLDRLKPRLAEVLATLPYDQRRAIELRVVDQIDYETLAATLGISEATARARVSRGLRALGSRLTADELALGLAGAS